jgi:hypothetical protein
MTDMKEARKDVSDELKIENLTQEALDEEFRDTLTSYNARQPAQTKLLESTGVSNGK